MGLKVGAVTLPDDAAGVSIGGTAVGGIVIDGDVVWRAPALTAPPVPAGLAVAATSATSLTASWSAAARATTYQIRYRRGTGAWTTPAADASLSRVITGLTAATQYRVQVRAINAAGMSSWSSTVRQTTAAAPTLEVPGPVRNLAGTPAMASIALTWDGPSTGGAVAGYDVRYDDDGGSGTLIELGANARGHSITGLTAGTAYRVRVWAKNATGFSTVSTVSVTTTGTAPVAVPPVPAGLTTSAATATSLTASWSAAARATSYQLDYRVSGASDWISLSGAARSRTITGLTAATTYQFRVRASNSSGNSAWSAIVTGTTAAAPSDTPVLISALYISGNTRVTWTVTLDAQKTFSRWCFQYRQNRNEAWITGTRGTHNDRNRRSSTRPGLLRFNRLRVEYTDGSSSAWSNAVEASSAVIPTGKKLVPFALDHPDRWLTLDGAPLVTIEDADPPEEETDND